MSQREDRKEPTADEHLGRIAPIALTNRPGTDILNAAWPAPNLPDLPSLVLKTRQRDFRLMSLSLSDRFGCIAGEEA